MKSRLTFASLVAATALMALPTASQAGGLDRMGDCLFGWMRHDRGAVVVKGEVHKKKTVKKAKRMAAAPRK
jgi:hypothetical protein